MPRLEEAGSQETLISSADDLFHEGRIRPLKNPPGPWPRQEEAKGSNNNNGSSTNTPTKSASANSKSRKWRLKDLFLFRSASEGRATGRGSKDFLRRYTLLPSFSSSFEHKGHAQVKSLKSEDGSNSMKLHYEANRAKSEEEKKKVPLPYHRNTLFGCLHFNPAVKSIAKGFGTRNSNSNSSVRGK